MYYNSAQLLVGTVLVPDPFILGFLNFKMVTSVFILVMEGLI